MADDWQKRVLPFRRAGRSKSGDAGRKSSPTTGAVVVAGWTALYQLRITLRDVEPPIWRRIQVPGSIDLASLHRVIQTAMGWSDGEFDDDSSGDWISRTGRGARTPPSDLGDGPSTLQSVLKVPGDSFIYASGSGDEWMHVIEVEEVRRSATGAAQTVCLGGSRNCPPADSDGPSAYAEFLVALRDPEHEAHVEAIESAGIDFDPERFDLEETNRRLARLSQA
jgi:hypothetical protein